MIKEHYVELLAGDAHWAQRARHLAARCHELVSFLHDIRGVTRLDARYDGTITYHDSCSGLRELGVKAQPRALLAKCPGVTLLEMKDARACCGFGGTFSVKYGDISTAIVDEKIEHIKATGAPCVVLGDLGCMLNIEGRLRRTGDTTTRVLHVAQVLAGREAPSAAVPPPPPAPPSAAAPDFEIRMPEPESAAAAASKER